MIFDKVTKKYGDRAVLEDFTLEVEKGKICAILGESGAGKTTLLNVASGLTTFEGKTDFGKCSYVFQSARLLPNLTVEGNLKFALDKSEWNKIPETLKKVGLSGMEKRNVETLSGGERQRVAIARAYLFPHDTLLLDEPFSSLDLAIKRDLISLVVALWKEKGSTILFVTHDVHEAALLSHRAVVLKKGKTVADIPIEGELPRDFFATRREEEKLIAALLR